MYKIRRDWQGDIQEKEKMLLNAEARPGSMQWDGHVCCQKGKQSQTRWGTPGIPTLSSGLAWARQRKPVLKKEEKEKKP